ncbi:MAG TPA: 6,7-dimethyl-8-ribityllumazine synthase [Rhizomicrobium sp.]|nr:6,7-dimethyl-8-ribityllumazine synthase [Rhizomicrobium sp.]
MTSNILIVEARFYEHISDALLAGAAAALEKAGATFDRIAVPGALEIPAAILFAAKASEGAGKSYDGFVALGCVIRGETYHFEIVSSESARGLTDLGLQHGLCIGNGILTVENEKQALVRAARDELDKGGDAARACLALIALKARLGARR